MTIMMQCVTAVAEVFCLWLFFDQNLCCCFCFAHGLIWLFFLCGIQLLYILVPCTATTILFTLYYICTACTYIHTWCIVLNQHNLKHNSQSNKTT